MKRTDMEERDDKVKDMTSQASEQRTNTATSQGDLPEPRLKKEDLPEADRHRFKDGVYSGSGTGAGPGGSTDTGGADTTSMEDRARLGTTDRTQASEQNPPTDE